MGQHCGIWQAERCCLSISSIRDKADWNNKSRNLLASTWVGVTVWRRSVVGSMFVHSLHLIPFNLLFLSLASIPVPRIWILDSAKDEQVTFATPPTFIAVSGVYASMCVCAATHMFGCIYVCRWVSLARGEGLPFYSPAVLESISSSWINILMENYKEDEYLETKGCRSRAENKKDCTSPRRQRPRNWLPIHLFYSCTYFIAGIFSSSPWLLILNCLPVPSLCLPCPSPPCPPLLQGPPKWYSLCH